MAEASGTDLAGYKAQLATTEMFYEPADGGRLHQVGQAAGDHGVRRQLPVRPRHPRRGRAQRRFRRHRISRRQDAGRRRTTSSCASTRPTWRWPPTGSSDRARSRTAPPSLAGRRMHDIHQPEARPSSAPALGALPFVARSSPLYAIGSAIRRADNPPDKLLPSLPAMAATPSGRWRFVPDRRTGDLLLWSDTAREPGPARRRHRHRGAARRRPRRR